MTSPKKQNVRKKRSTSRKPSSLPHVLLMVETSGSVGRGIIEGIGRYALENGPWSIEYEYRSLDSLPPEWLNGWQGDGIISRTTNAKQAKMLRAAKVPLVELFGDPKISPIHVMSDYVQEGDMAAEHFFESRIAAFRLFFLRDRMVDQALSRRISQGVGKSGIRLFDLPSARRASGT